MALEHLRQLGARGGQYVLDADISDYFGSIEHDKLLTLIGQRVSDPRMLKLIRQWLQAGVLEDGKINQPKAGTPQGGVISPLLSNIYLHVLDKVWAKHCVHLGTLVRYADVFVVLSESQEDCEEDFHQACYQRHRPVGGPSPRELSQQPHARPADRQRQA